MQYRTWLMSLVVFIVCAMVGTPVSHSDETGNQCDCGPFEPGYTNFESYGAGCRIFYDHEFMVCDGVIYVRVTDIWTDPWCPPIPQSEKCAIICASVEHLVQGEVSLECQLSISNVSISFAAGLGCTSCP